MTDHDPTSSEQQAAEYALGVLTAPERAEAERRIKTDSTFAALVGWWEERLSALLDALPGQTPPRVVWMRIAAQLGLERSAPAGERGFWSNIAVWRAATGAFAVAAAASVAVIMLSPETPTQVVSPVTPPAALTAVGMLKAEDGPTSFVVTFDRANQRLIIAPVGASGAPDKSFELWMLPNGGDPVSMGMLDENGVMTIGTDKLVGPDGERAALAVTIEPRGGSPSGLPTGPVIASGKLEPI